MKVAVVTGGRNHSMVKKEWLWFLALLENHKVKFVAVGDCPTGVDKTIRAGLTGHYEGAVFHAAWKLLGKKAGPTRNDRMAAFSASQREHGMVIVFPGGVGTKNCKSMCTLRGLYVAEYKSGEVNDGSGL